MSKVTFEQINEFLTASNQVLQAQKEEKESKLTYALKKVQKRIRKHIDDYMEVMRDIEVEHASTDADGNLKYDGDKLVYTPLQEKNMRKKKREVYAEWLKKEFEFEPYIATEIKEELSIEQKEALTGFVI